MEHQRQNSYQGADGNVSTGLSGWKRMNLRNGLDEKDEEKGEQYSCSDKAGVGNKLQKIILGMSHETTDRERAIHGEDLGKGSQAGTKERKILDDLGGVHPEQRAHLEIFGSGEETADYGVQADPGRPQHSQAKN